MTELLKDVIAHLETSSLDQTVYKLSYEITNYEGHHYICDVISEIADNYIDIYYYDLFKWLPDNYEWVEEAIAQGLCDTSKPDIPKMIQAGQYECFTQELYDNLDDMLLYYCLNYIQNELQVSTITDKRLEKLQKKCTEVDNNDTLDMFEEFCDELMHTKRKGDNNE